MVALWPAGRGRWAWRALLTLYVGANMQHIFPIYCGFLPEADAAVATIGRWIRERVA